MDDDDRKAEAPLKLAEKTEKPRDFLSVVFIGGMQTDKRVEEKQPWLESRQRCAKPLLVPLGVESKARLGDDHQIELLKWQ